MRADIRQVRILDLIAEIFGDEKLTRRRVQEILEEIQEDVESRLSVLKEGEVDLGRFLDDEDRSC